MPINILIVGSKPCCQHQKVQTTGALEGTQPAQEELTCWSVEETSLMCPRGSCVPLPVHRGDGRRCLLPRCPEGFCRTRAGILSLLHRWSRGREPIHFCPRKTCRFWIKFSCPHQSFEGSFQAKCVNHQVLCLWPRGLGASDSSGSKHAWSKTVSHSPLHAHVVPPDPNLFPPARLPRAWVAAGAAQLGWWEMRPLLGEK